MVTINVLYLATRTVVMNSFWILDTFENVNKAMNHVSRKEK